MPRLFILEDFDHLVEIAVAFLKILAFGSDVAIVERVKRCTELVKELEGDLDFALGVGDGVRSVVPWAQSGADSERVGEHVAEGMPVHHRKTQVLLHRFPVDDFVGVIVLEFQRVPRLGPTKLDFGHIREKLGHRRFSLFDQLTNWQTPPR